MTAFDPRNPDYEAAVRDSFARQGLMATLGASLVAVGPGWVEIAADYHDGLSQQYGFFHGGVIGAIADSAGGYAAFSLMPPESNVLTVEYKMNIVAPGRGERLIARGAVIRPGRTLTVSRADVFAIDGGAETLCATMLQTLMCLAAAAHRPAG
ncbi:MAG: PaaI family thioesterase [Alphaproteobacteria bacterium]|nr:PaaI family thioesterase [Alphaproteobacteria bacterium]